MAMLLAMFQKMRLTREYNRETLNLTRFSHKVDRIAKSIKNIQKMYAAKIKGLENYTKSIINGYQQDSLWKNGLADNSLYNKYLQEGLEKNSIWNKYQENNGNILAKDSDGNDIFDSGERSAIQSVMTQVSQYVSQVNMSVSMDNKQFETMRTLELEHAKEQIEREQEMELEPLEYEQTMMELDKEASEERCQRLKAEIESYDQLLKEETKNAAPKFGLG